MAGSNLSKQWTSEEAATEAKDSDESLVIAPTTHARRLVSQGAVGGAEHRAGEQDDLDESEEERSLQTRPFPADPPRTTESTGGA